MKKSKKPKKPKKPSVWDTINSKVKAAVDAAGHKHYFVIYSAYDTDPTDPNDEPIDNLDQVAVTGKVILIGECDEYWGGEACKYVSKVLDNPTWLNVAVCANAMIMCTRDQHHVFLEGLREMKSSSVARLKEKIARAISRGIKVYEFCMGS